MVTHGNPPATSSVWASIQQLIANGNSKLALDRAKQLHKDVHNAESEGVLIEAYAARIQALLKQDLRKEAASLMDLVAERFPGARARIELLHREAELRSGSLDNLLRPLSDPALDAAQRRTIEQLIETGVVDLGAIACCEALAQDHPLRSAAAALEKAFRAVTSGPTRAGGLALNEVSRKSPLAAWKYLVRAIACFYRGEQEAALACLDSIAPGSVPARLIPALRSVLGKGGELTAAARTLLELVHPDPDAFQLALRNLDREFGSRSQKPLLKAIREAVEACQRHMPAQVEFLKRHISVRCALIELPPALVLQAMGGPSIHDSEHARLYARALEERADPQDLMLACGLWDQFRLRGIQEGRLTGNGVEAAQVYLHIAAIAEQVPRSAVYALHQQRKGQSKPSSYDTDVLEPNTLYQKACAIDPHPEAFRQWLSWAKRRAPGTADDVAQSWSKACPADLEPVLFLVESYAGRKAFPTALKHLQKAEAIDSMHPDARKMRVRLLIGGALKQLQQKKPHLALEKIVELETLAEIRQGDRAALPPALHHILRSLQYESEPANRALQQVEALLGGPLLPRFLVNGLAEAGKLPFSTHVPGPVELSKEHKATIPQAVARLHLLARYTQLPMSTPWAYQEEVATQTALHGETLTVEQLEALGRGGIEGHNLNLVFAASSAGLERGPGEAARFLLLRARSVPHQQQRQLVCATAAVQLAHERHDVDLMQEALALTDESEPLRFTKEQALEVARRERAEKKLPSYFRGGPSYEDILEEAEDALDRKLGFDGEDEEFGDDFDDGEFDMDETPLPPSMPHEMARMLVEAAAQVARSGMSFEDLIKELGAPGLPAGGRGQGRRKGKGRRR